MEDKLYVYLIRSRNKDNKDIEGFKERAKTLIMYESKEDKVRREFELFASGGLVGEKTRLYKSVNARDEEKCRKGLMHRLIDGASIANIETVLASVCQQKENRAESKWLFDFDCTDTSVLESFVKDVEEHSPVSVHKTPNGYAVVSEHGFDTRELFEKYKDYDIGLKKDELLFLDIIEKEE